MNDKEIQYKRLAEELTTLSSFVPVSKDEMNEWYDRAQLLQKSDLFEDVPHFVWHYLSDVDIRMKDEAYAEMQNEQINSLIDDLNRGVMPEDLDREI